MAAAFLLSGIAYRLSSIDGISTQDFNKNNELFLFNSLIIINLFLGLYFFYYNDAVTFLQNHTYALLSLSLFCIAWTGLYLLKYKLESDNFYYPLFRLFVYSLAATIEFLKTRFFKDFSGENLLFLSIISRLFSTEKEWETINNKYDS